jgi:hypothetical protein
VCQAGTGIERYLSSEVTGRVNVDAGQASLWYNYLWPTHPWMVTRSCPAPVIWSEVTYPPMMRDQSYGIAVSCHAYFLRSTSTNAPQWGTYRRLLVDMLKPKLE